jgi:thiamine pyrophosphokinase
VVALILLFTLGLRPALFELVSELAIVLLFLGGGGGRVRRTLESLLAQMRGELAPDAA